ncbi:C-type lectin domain family 2 member B-like isoform X1 [Anguilla rostrata]|uniref:C-type lectin domain-containing protein n=1 Tax=Anguilla anguilla TaxID=7936 RepID=A0A9D3RTH4_ANGAN|nr:C-type lectin domain family 2 member B-like [Anguilla anguilla]KAG5842473.1 hypothetical protein ANANG_G00178000 [Anguilla anguilla]
MDMSVRSKDDEYENTGGIYTGLILPDNNEYSTLKPTSNPIQEAQKTAKSRLCCPPYKVATVCLGLLCAFSVIVIIILFVYLEVPKQCPVGYVQFTSRCYHFSSEKDDWFNSRKLCKRQGADLVVIDTMEEQVFVHSHYTHSKYWIGLRNSSEERTWLWVDGSQLDVGYWDDGEPNNLGLNEDCVHGYKDLNALKNWNDIKCDNHFNWVCETSRP